MYGVEVMENVFRGIQVLTDSTRGASGEVIHLDRRAWLVATTISAVHVKVLTPEDR
jgi:hypothetical protein